MINNKTLIYIIIFLFLPITVNANLLDTQLTGWTDLISGSIGNTYSVDGYLLDLKGTTQSFRTQTLKPSELMYINIWSEYNQKDNVFSILNQKTGLWDALTTIPTSEKQFTQIIFNTTNYLRKDNKLDIQFRTTNGEIRIDKFIITSSSASESIKNVEQVDRVSLVDKVSNVDKVNSVDYINQGKMTIHGTEYTFGQTSKAWLQLINSTGSYINDGICFINIYYPDQTIFLENAQMSNANYEGIYFYDIILPDIQGVYPVIAKCYYEAIQTDYYATNYTITTGKVESGTLINTHYQDGDIMRFREQDNGSGIRRLNMTLSFNNISSCLTVNETFLTNLNIYSYSKFDSVTNDDLTISIWNYTNNQWITLSNKIIEGSSYQGTSNVIITNNITKSGFYKNNTAGILLKINDTTLADGGDSDWSIDQIYVGCDQLANSQWQEVKGSSEFHLSNPQGYKFVSQTLCGEEAPDSPQCAYFEENNDFDPEGAIIENITITNQLGTPITQILTYETAYSIDCTAIDSINLIVGNTTTDLTNQTIYTLGNNENCELKIPIELLYGETIAKVNIVMDNYMRWETLRTKDLVIAYRPILDEYCDAIANQYNFTYETPLSTTMINQTNESSLIGCGRVKDDLYWYDTYLNQSEECYDVECYENLFFEINRWYFPELYREFETINQILRNNNQLTILSGIIQINETVNNINLSIEEINNTEILNTINQTVTNINTTTTNHTSLLQQIWDWIQNIFNWVNTDNDANASTTITTTDLTMKSEIIQSNYYETMTGTIPLKVNINGITITDANCNISIYNPNATNYINNQAMNYDAIIGMYLYSWTPNNIGSYPTQTTCTRNNQTSIASGILQVNQLVQNDVNMYMITG